jgi:post-segregation antitoxin (ccd killing protein)
MRMARVNVYLPDELAREAKEAGLNISGLTQEALRSALAARQSAQWLDGLQALGPTDVTHEAVLKAVAAAKDDLEGRG